MPHRITFVDDRSQEPSDPFEDVSTSTLIGELYSDSAALGVAERARLAHIKALAGRLVRRDDDCVDMVQWVSQHLGIGSYRAKKLTACAYAIDDLPLISEAL